MIKLTDEQIDILLDMGGSLFSPDDCLEYLGEKAGLPYGIQSFDILNWHDFITTYENDYFICDACGHPFDQVEKAELDDFCQLCLPCAAGED